MIGASIFGLPALIAAHIGYGETRDVRKSIPFALFTAIAATTILYVAVEYLVIHTIPNAGGYSAPVEDSARRFLPQLGSQIVAAGTLVAACGYLSTNMLHTPRITFAMGEHGDFSAFFGKIHPRFRKPHLSIMIFAMMLHIFSIAGNFRWNAMLPASRVFLSMAQ
jgi:amino acid transporter